MLHALRENRLVDGEAINMHHHVTILNSYFIASQFFLAHNADFTDSTL